MSFSAKPDISYYMPLSNGASPKDGPSKSVFSVPKFDYSPETRNLVKNFMDESRLTFTQKSGFQSILRNGKALPTRPGDVFRQQLFKHRHAERARSIGMAVMNPTHHPFMSKGNNSMKFTSGGRRSFEQIQLSGELEPPIVQSRKYVPCDKEKEKIRFAHRMAFGKDPPPVTKNAGNPFGPKVSRIIPEDETPTTSDASIMQNRFYELMKEIQDRIDFLDSMKVLGNERAYRTSIVSQIQELVAQMKSISPEKAEDCIKTLKLDKIDKCFSKEGYEFDNIFERKRSASADSN